MARRNRWVKFGECAGQEGPEPGITETEPDIDFVLGNEDKRKFNLLTEKEQLEMEILYKELVTAGTVWKRKNVDRNEIQKNRDERQNANNVNTPGKYVHPRKRNEQERFAIRVTNLHDDTQKEDLEQIFGKYGRIEKIYLDREPGTQRSKGYAFIHYMEKSSAETAIVDIIRKKIGFNNLILNVEWARPSKR